MKLTMRLDTSSLVAELRKRDTATRKKALRQSAAEGGKVLGRATKAAVKVRLGLLKKSIGTKTKVYASRSTCWCGSGPRTQFRYKVTRSRTKRGKERIKTTRAPAVLGTPRDSGEVRWPNKYAHLAGPGRRARFPQQVINSNRAAVQAAMARPLAAVVAGRT